MKFTELFFFSLTNLAQDANSKTTVVRSFPALDKGSLPHRRNLTPASNERFSFVCSAGQVKKECTIFSLGFDLFTSLKYLRLLRFANQTQTHYIYPIMTNTDIPKNQSRLDKNVQLLQSARENTHEPSHDIQTFICEPQAVKVINTELIPSQLSMHIKHMGQENLKNSYD